MCWGGDGRSGALGQPQFEPPIGDEVGEYPLDLDFISLGTGAAVTKLATSGSHVCALFRSGRVKCWGNNAQGQLGIGSTENIGDEFDELGNLLDYISID